MTSTSIRLIASDIDGTLLRGDGTMSRRTVDALAAAEAGGILVVLCTGRPIRWMAPIAEQTGHHGLAVCANGAVLYDLHTERVVEQFPMDVEIARRIALGLREAVPGIAFAVERATGMLHEPEYVPLGRYQNVEATFDELLTEPMVKLIAKHPEMSSTDLYRSAHDAIADLADVVETTYSSGTIVEISAVGVTKAFGLERVADERGISAEEVVAFGDMPNDIPMLAWAGHAVAVGTAHPDVTAIADEVTATNDDDGVALVIERLLSLP